ncbi:hypothetical protein BJX68DRAFT_270814 [Aspergillus pseudodeflectus]|uniref:Uncharacterized protein n=1 Tax=Aspergillus pseudodeflectus TaxID=176178 RepID=A0ABR4JQI4_9EURO
MSTPPNVPLPAADVGRVLDTAHIPYTLFGWWAAACHGRNNFTREIDFVIHNDKVDTAASELVATGHFHRCTDPNCLEPTENRCDRTPVRQGGALPMSVWQEQLAPNNYHAVAREHLHIEPTKYEYFRVISLYAQSQLLWSFPELSTTDNRGFMIPTHAILVEALFFLRCRDLGHIKHVDAAWGGMLNAAFGPRFIDNDMNLTEEMKALRRDIREISPRWLPALEGYLFPSPGSGVHPTTALNRMRAILLANNELPDIPPHDLRGFHM